MRLKLIAAVHIIWDSSVWPAHKDNMRSQLILFGQQRFIYKKSKRTINMHQKQTYGTLRAAPTEPVISAKIHGVP